MLGEPAALALGVVFEELAAEQPRVLAGLVSLLRATQAGDSQAALALRAQAQGGRKPACLLEEIPRRSAGSKSDVTPLAEQLQELNPGAMLP
ncbi:MAG: hypothetical protein HYV63_05430 [Candidatus Schekmanbacteria bacterium]|nr:hypothetical protein [Candidatus Schekmanbacteria bacterium]